MSDGSNTNLWADRESGQVVRVDKVDSTYAVISVLRSLPSHYSMPITDYDTVFVKRYTPVDAGGMKVPDDYRAPINAAEYLARERGELPPEDESVDASRNETSEGVRIGVPDPGITALAAALAGNAPPMSSGESAAPSDDPPGIAPV